MDFERIRSLESSAGAPLRITSNTARFGEAILTPYEPRWKTSATWKHCNLLCTASLRLQPDGRTDPLELTKFLPNPTGTLDDLARLYGEQSPLRVAPLEGSAASA